MTQDGTTTIKRSIIDPFGLLSGAVSAVASRMVCHPREFRVQTVIDHLLTWF
jgi:hypothetical protein